MVVAQCPCGAKYKIPEESRGRKARCKKCGQVFEIRPSEQETIPLADDAQRVSGSRSRPAGFPPPEGTPPAETATDSRCGAAEVSTAYDPDAEPRVDHLPRTRPRAGFWSDVAWTLAFFVSPHSLVLFFVVWVLLILTAFLYLPGLFLMGAVLSLVSLVIGMYVTAWYMSIIVSAAAGEEDLPNFTATGDFLDDVLVPCLQYAGTALGLLLPAILYFIFLTQTSASAGALLSSGLDLFTMLTTAGPAEAPLIALVLLAVFLWPIAIMCVSMGGLSSLLRIDLIILAVLRTFPAYFLIFVMVSVARFLPGFIVSAAAGPATGTGGIKSNLVLTILAKGVELYFSIVTMRLIGLYYLHFKERFPWDWE
jgi:hypothetical protein